MASGDSRLPAIQTCWPAQADMERKIIAAIAGKGFTVKRAHPFDDEVKHGFIWNQRMGMDVFKTNRPKAPLVFAVVIWPYTKKPLNGWITLCLMDETNCTKTAPRSKKSNKKDPRYR